MLQREEVVHQTQLELDGQQYALIEGVRLPTAYFRTQRQGNTTNLLLMRTNHGYFHIYVDDAVEYLGTDLPPHVFTDEFREGWRRLAVPNDGSVGDVLKQLDTVLGLDGAVPKLPEPEPRNTRAETQTREDRRVTRHKADLDKVVEQFGKDLTALAQAGHLSPVIGREREMGQVIRILMKRGKSAPLLIGEPGVGKSAVVEGLAQRVAAGSIVEPLRESRLIEINLGFLAAGAGMKGEVEERVLKVVNAAKADPNVILFFDELHTICSTRGDNDVATLLKSDLARGAFKVIGATTYRDFKQSIEKDGALARRFQQVRVNEPSEAETRAILQGLRPYLQQHHQVHIPDAVIEAAIQLSAWYLPERYQPDKAIDLLDEACARRRLASNTVQVAPDDIIA